MPVSPLFYLRRAAGVLAAFGLGLGAQAQTAPAWSLVRALGVPPVNYGGGAVVDAAGNTYQAGTFNGTLTLDGVSITSAGSEDGYLAKYTPAGRLAWVRGIGAGGADGATGVALDAAGNVYVTGNFQRPISLSPTVHLTLGSTTGGNKAYVVRYSPQGTPEWAQQSLSNSSNPSLATDALGHVYLSGQFSNSLTLGNLTLANNGYFSLYLARLSAATGAVESLSRAAHYLPPTGSSSWYYGSQLSVAPTGEAYLCTVFSQGMVYTTATLPANPVGNQAIAKYNAQGANEWVRTITSPTGAAGGGRADAAGNLYLAGVLSSPATIGSTAVPNAGGQDMFLVKYSPQGAVQWVQSGGGGGHDRWHSIALDAAGNPYLIGVFEATIQLGPFTLTSAGGSDVVVAAYSAQGVPRWVQQAGGTGPDSGAGLGLDGAGNIYTLGTFTSTATFAPLTINTPVPSIFMARLGTAGLPARAGRPLALGVYPTPAHDVVHLPGLAPGSRVQLLDALGRVAREASVSAAATVSVRGLPAGLYTLRATGADGLRYAGKVAVE